MQKLDFVENDQYVTRVGDLCGNLYIPLVLPGRYKSNIEDIESILDVWVNWKYEKTKKKKKKSTEEITQTQKEEKCLILDQGHEQKQEDSTKEENKNKNKKKEKEKKKNRKKKSKDLYKFSLIFKEYLFSLVLFKSKYENAFCAWQTFWCAWIDVFKESFKKDNKYEKKYFKKLNEFRVGCIYLLFLLYFSQYVNLYDCAYPIYMSTDTVSLCLDVMEECEKVNKFFEIRFILNFMFDTNSIVLSYNERLSESFQDRYGFPLYLEKGKLIDGNSVEINDVHLDKLHDVIMKEMKDFSEFYDDNQGKNQENNNSSIYNVHMRLKHIKKLLNDT